VPTLVTYSTVSARKYGHLRGENVGGQGGPQMTDCVIFELHPRDPSVDLVEDVGECDFCSDTQP
jgi:hypothetical protein